MRIPHQGILQVCSSVNNYLGQIVFSETCPAVGSLPENYRTWIDNTILILNQQVQITETEIDALEMKKNLLAEDYAEATQNSLGLSGNMIIERVTDSPPSISVARSTATFVFVGGILGLIAWGLFWLTKISLNRKTLRSPEANA